MLEIIAIETVYLLLVVFPAFFIFNRTRKLFSFSSYKGIRYISSAFLYLAVGFILRFIVMLSKNSLGTIKTFGLLTLLMEFFLIMPGLLLLYSLVWQGFERSLFSRRSIALVLLHLIAAVIAVADWYLGSLILLYSSQIIAFAVASVLSFQRYTRKRNNFMQMYFMAMVLFWLVWVINLIAQYTIDMIPAMRLYAYGFTVAGLLMFFYMTIKLTSGYR